MSLMSKIRDWFKGGNTNRSTSTRGTTRTTTTSTNRSGVRQIASQVDNSAEEERKRRIKEAFAESNKKAEEARTKARTDAEKSKSTFANTQVAKKKTNVAKQELDAMAKAKGYSGYSKVDSLDRKYMQEDEKVSAKNNPLAYTFAKSALNGTTLGASNMLAKHATSTAEQQHQAQVNKIVRQNATDKQIKRAELAGELAGSFAIFGAGAGASKAVVSATRLAPQVAKMSSKLASTEMMKRVGAQMVKKGVFEGTVEQAAKHYAEKLATELTADAVLDHSMSLVDSANRASVEDGNLEDKVKAFLVNQGLNVGVSGAVDLSPALVRALKGSKAVKEVEKKASNAIKKEFSPTRAEVLKNQREGQLVDINLSRAVDNSQPQRLGANSIDFDSPNALQTNLVNRGREAIPQAKKDEIKQFANDLVMDGRSKNFNRDLKVKIDYKRDVAKPEPKYNDFELGNMTYGRPAPEGTRRMGAADVDFTPQGNYIPEDMYYTPPQVKQPRQLTEAEVVEKSRRDMVSRLDREGVATGTDNERIDYWMNKFGLEKDRDVINDDGTFANPILHRIYDGRNREFRDRANYVDDNTIQDILHRADVDNDAPSSRAIIEAISENPTGLDSEIIQAAYVKDGKDMPHRQAFFWDSFWHNNADEIEAKGRGYEYPLQYYKDQRLGKLKSAATDDDINYPAYFIDEMDESIADELGYDYAEEYYKNEFKRFGVDNYDDYLTAREKYNELDGVVERIRHEMNVASSRKGYENSPAYIMAKEDLEDAIAERDALVTEPIAKADAMKQVEDIDDLEELDYESLLEDLDDDEIAELLDLKLKSLGVESKPKKPKPETKATRVMAKAPKELSKKSNPDFKSWRADVKAGEGIASARKPYETSAEISEEIESIKERFPNLKFETIGGGDREGDTVVSAGESDKELAVKLKRYIDRLDDRRRNALFNETGGESVGKGINTRSQTEYQGFDLNKPSNSFHGEGINVNGDKNGKRYLQVEMSPDEYVARCQRQVFKKPTDGGTRRTGEQVDEYVKAMKNGDKFPVPYLNFSSVSRNSKGELKTFAGQEGLHRAEAAKRLGIDKIPVTIIDNPYKPTMLTDEVMEKALAKSGNPIQKALAERSGKLGKYEPPKEKPNIEADFNVRNNFKSGSEPRGSKAATIKYEAKPSPKTTAADVENLVARNEQIKNEVNIKERQLENARSSNKARRKQSEIDALKAEQSDNEKTAYEFNAEQNRKSELRNELNDINKKLKDYERTKKQLAATKGSGKEYKQELLNNKEAIQAELKSMDDGTWKAPEMPKPKKAKAKKALEQAEPVVKEEPIPDMPNTATDTVDDGVKMANDGVESPKVEAEANATSTEAAKTEVPKAEPTRTIFVDKDGNKAGATVGNISVRQFGGTDIENMSLNDYFGGDLSHIKPASETELTKLGIEGKMPTPLRQGKIDEAVEGARNRLDGTGDMLSKSVASALKHSTDPEFVKNMTKALDTLGVSALELKKASKKVDWSNLFNGKYKVKDFNEAFAVSQTEVNIQPTVVMDRLWNKWRYGYAMNHRDVFDTINLMSFAEAHGYKDVRNFAAQMYTNIGNESGTLQGALSYVSRTSFHLLSPAQKQLTIDKQIDKLCTELGQNRDELIAKINKNNENLIDEMFKKRGEDAKGFEFTKADVDKGDANFFDILLDNIKHLPDNAQSQDCRDLMIKVVNQNAGTSVIGNVNALRYLSMLSNPATHERNIIGNGISFYIRGLNQAFEGGVQNKLLKEGKIDYKTSTRLSMNDVADSKSKDGVYGSVINKYMDEDKATVMSSTTGMLDRQIAANAAKDAGLFKKMVTGGNNRVGGALEKVDAKWVGKNYRRKMAQFLKANGYGTDKVNIAANGGYFETEEALINKARQFAREDASEATFRGANKFSTWVNKQVRQGSKPNASITDQAKSLAISTTVPFATTTSNILMRGIDLSPLGLLKAGYQFKEAKYLGAEKYLEATRTMCAGLTGTGIAGLGMFLALNNNDATSGIYITGTLDSSDPADAALMRAGMKEYAINCNIAGSRWSIPLSWCPPMAFPFFMGVQAGHAIQNAADREGENVFDSISQWEGVIDGIIVPFMDMSMMQGVNNVLSSVKDAEGVSPVTAGAAAIFQNAVGQVIPQPIAKLSDALADSKYELTGDAQTGMGRTLQYSFNSNIAKIPFLSKAMLPEKVDGNGEVVNKKEGTGDHVKALAKNLFDPTSFSKVKMDDADEESYNLYLQAVAAGVKPENAEKAFSKFDYSTTRSIGKSGKGVEAETINLTPKQRAEAGKAKASNGADAVEALIKSRAWNAQLDKDNRDAVNAAIRGKNLKSTAEVRNYLITTDVYKNASVEDKISMFNAINNTGGEYSVNKKAYMDQGHTEADYDFKVLVPVRVQAQEAALTAAGVSKQQVVDFAKAAEKRYYAEDGTVTTQYTKKSMYSALGLNEFSGLADDQKAAIYNAFKTKNSKEYGASGSGSGRRRSGGGGRSSKSSTKQSAAVTKAFKTSVKNSDYKKLASNNTSAKHGTIRGLTDSEIQALIKEANRQNLNTR